MLFRSSVTVSDDGRGIPCGIVAKTGKSAVETVYTVLHAGGKFEGSDGYKVSGGLHGVGASVVNALSLFVEVQVKREGIIHLIRFENGGHVVAPGLREIGTCPENETGTQVTFLADPTIFTQTTVYNYSEVRDYLRQTAFLNKGLCIDLYDERTPELTHDRFLYAGGSAKNGRDSYTQAILPLRGKILNVQKAQATRIEKNAEIDNMIQAIGTGINDHFELSKLRLDRKSVV